jgi:hypothetical protein
MGSKGSKGRGRGKRGRTRFGFLRFSNELEGTFLDGLWDLETSETLGLSFLKVHGLSRVEATEKR